MIFDWGSDTDPHKDAKDQNTFPMIGLAPQCPWGRQWTDADMIKAVDGLMEEMSKKLRVDPDRVYALPGADMGAVGIYRLAAADSSPIRGNCSVPAAGFQSR